jgi:membrane associated rhomboid family serine protease
VTDVIPSPAAVRARTRRPTATYTIIAINVLVQLYGQSMDVQNYNRFLLNWALIPLRFTHPDSIANDGYVQSPRILTLVTSLFLHSGLVHIGLNMLLLYAIGRMVEMAIGTPRFLVLYFAAGLGSSLAVILLYRDSIAPFIGASGAVYGVMGGFFLLLPPGPDRVKTIGWTLALIVVPALIPANVVQRFTGSDFLANIAHWGHVGGFLVGAATMYIMLQIARRRRPHMIAPDSDDVPAGSAPQ